MNTIKRILAVTVVTPLFCASLRAEACRDQSCVSFDTGLALQQPVTIRDTLGGTSAKAEFAPGLRFDLAAEYPLDEFWSIGLETGIIFNPVNSLGGVPISSLGGSLDFYEFPLLFDVTYRLPPQGYFQAYVSAGVGGVATWFYQDQFNYSSDLTLGYQVAIGTNYELGKNWELGLAYKLLGTTRRDFGNGFEADGNLTHSFLATLTCKF
ncbi:MAG: hypothetical protein EPO07_15935 [Verrucomicrobia bacterium]|nr:MAG: hypothetical protein EPO07_15935 [Verrucomicrobiota bacterium]